MPNRIIKESIRESYSLDALSSQAEITFYRLITYADDYGLFKCDPLLVNKALFPLKNYTEIELSGWLNEIATGEMIKFYVGSDGKPYGFFVNWSQFQTIRNKRPKYPPLEDGCEGMCDIIKVLKSIEINCKQKKANVTVIQSNPNPNPSSYQGKI